MLAVSGTQPELWLSQAPFEKPCPPRSFREQSGFQASVTSVSLNNVLAQVLRGERVQPLEV